MTDIVPLIQYQITESFWRNKGLTRLNFILFILAKRELSTTIF